MVRLELTDQPEDRARWWFVNEAGHCALAGHDPGAEPNVSLAATLPDMIYVVRGDLPLARAAASGRLEIVGEPAARHALGRWLNMGPLARVHSERAAAERRA